MHDQIYQAESDWAQHLEGSYFQRAVLKQLTERGSELWYLDHGARALIRSDHCNTNLVRWIVGEEGISLAGPAPETLIDPIYEEILREENFATITTWGQAILDDPSPYNNWYYQSYIVLNFCRMLHDLHRGYPGSKWEGAEWAKTVFDPAWSDLIDRAWDGRPDPAQKIKQAADVEDFRRTLEFLEMIIKESRRAMTEE